MWKKSCITRYTQSKHTTRIDNKKKDGRNTAKDKVFPCKDETSPRLDCKYALKSDLDVARINNLQYFPLNLDCQNNHYELDLLGNSTSKPISYSSWIKNNTQQKPLKQKNIGHNYAP